MEKKPMGKKTIEKKSIEKKSIEKKTKDKELADNVPADRKTGKVSLVGAGCGDPELLTLKGLNCLRQCDAVLYDSLAAQELLELTPVGCEKINVGKRYGGKAMPQEDINELLVEKAREGKYVVRLKGGDPYVFGRGGEEMLVLKDEGIPCEEIPGITSAIAAPAAAGIPVTHRQCSRMVTILTASAINSEGKKEALTQVDYKALAQLQGTLVVLMGMHHLEELALKLMEAGKSPETPAAVIMEGATIRQRSVRATLGTIAKTAAEAGLNPPAVIVIGEVAALDLMPQEPSFSSGELQGLHIGVTGTEGFSGRLAAALREKGACVTDCGFLKAVPTEKELPDFAEFDWLCFTSPNGVMHFFDKLRQEKRDLRTLMGMRIAVIGPGTGKKLEEYGFYPDICPEIFDAEHLGIALAEKTAPSERILLCRAEKGSPALTERLLQAGREFTDFALYSLRIDPEKRKNAVRMAAETDYLLFGSASGVETFFEGLREEGVLLPERVKLACIGERCAARLKEMELQNRTTGDTLVAEEFTIEGLVRCVMKSAAGGRNP